VKEEWGDYGEVGYNWMERELGGKKRVDT